MTKFIILESINKELGIIAFNIEKIVAIKEVLDNPDIAIIDTGESEYCIGKSINYILGKIHEIDSYDEEDENAY